MTTKSIYKITNNLNNKIYIGQSIHPEQRFKEHCYRTEKYTSLIGSAIQKYGKENFSFEIIEQDIEDYNEKEKYWIDFYNTLSPNGYNIALGGEEPPIHYGENNSSALHTLKQVELVKHLLRTTTLSKEEIAAQTGYADKSAINRINIGKIWNDPEEKYPIRKDFMGNFSAKERWIQIVDYLQNSDLTQKEIADLCGVKRSAVTMINIGKNGSKWGEEYGYSYPLRKK